MNRQLKKLILISVLVALTGLAILIVILLGESDEITTGQILSITLILLLWPIGFLVNHYRKKRSAQAAAAAERGEEAVSPSSRNEDLARGAEEAVQWLRSTRLGAGRNGDAIYRLPWYLLVGPPGSGKTALLLSSGLSFNALPSQRRREQNLLRPTRDCEWRMTDHAVLVDTAGRYVTENAGEQEEWLGVIETLKSYRQQRPLDGFVLAVDAGKVLRAGDAEVEQQAQLLRARLDEAIKRTGAGIPVYLVFTHADAITGFNEFFQTLNPMERSQVWGATIPLAQARNAHELFDVEFDYLVEALKNRRLLRLGSSGTADEQLNIFNFPGSFSGARQKLARFTNTLFKPNPFSEKPLLRGFYFTNSLPHEGNGHGEMGDEGALVASPGIFNRDFFQEVLFRDKDVAASFQQSGAQPGRLRKIKIAAAALGLLGLLLLGGMVISYARNQSIINEADAAGRAVFSRMGGGTEAGLREDELRDLNRLRELLVQLDENEQSWLSPVLSRFGLYSGNRISPRLHEIYFDFLSNRLVKPAVGKLEDFLKTNPQSAQGSASEKDLDLFYNKTKAYLMLENRDRVEQDELQKSLAEYWAEPGQKENLAFFVEQASRHDDENLRIPRFRADPEVVKQARGKLANYPPTSRLYNQLISKINEKIKKNNETEVIDLRKITEGQGTEYFEGVNVQSVPGSFTKEAYYRYLLGDAITSLLEEAGKEDYVTGQTGGQPDPKVLKERYFKEYAAHWKSFLEGVAISKSKTATKEQAQEMLEKFAAANSPIVFLAERVAYQTNLSEPPTSSGVIGWIKGFFASKIPVAESQTVQSDFRALHNFVKGKDDNGPIAQYRKALDGLRSKLREVDGDWDKVAEKSRENPNAMGIKAAEDAVNAALGPLKDSPAGALLQQPVARVRDAVFKGNYEEVARRWIQLYPAARNLEAGFPFSESPTDALIQDLNDFLNPATGKLKEFLSMSKDYFNQQGEQWQLKNTARDKFSDRFVAYLNNAVRLQNALFQNGQLKVDCTITLTPGADGELSVDGKAINAQDKRSDTFSWPNTSGARIASKQGGAPLDFPKSWGLYRMFVKGGGDSRKAGRGYQLSWRLDSGATVSAQLEPLTSKDPFDLNLFRQLRAPKTLTEP